MKHLAITLIALISFSFNSNAQGGCTSYFQSSTQNCPYIEFFDISSVDSLAGEQVVSWQWDLGDGGTANTPNPIYTYSADGVYTVCLTILTSTGCTSTYCDQVTVDCLTQQGCIDPTLIDSTALCPQVFDPVCGCDSVTYSNSCEAINYGGVTSYTQGACGTQSSCNASFSISPNSACPNYIFNDMSTSTASIVDWNYDFGDASTSTSQNPNHTYTTNGVYTVCLYITTADSCTSWFCDDVTVDCLGQQTNCQAGFNIDDSISQCPTVQFYDVSTANFSIGEWDYDFGDGSTSQSQNPSHTYTSNGTYTVCLYITSADSCTSSYCETVVINCLASVNENEAIKMIVSPNPASSSFSLNLQQNKGIQYRIYGMSGQVFDNGVRSSAIEHQFDITYLSKGMYLLEIVMDEQREIIRFIKE